MKNSKEKLVDLREEVANNEELFPTAERIELEEELFGEDCFDPEELRKEI